MVFLEQAGSMGAIEDDSRRYLCVDEFMRTLIDARALQSAFELGVIDTLLKDQPLASTALGGRLRIGPQGIGFLLDLLRIGGVVEVNEDQVRLSEKFMDALAYRDLLEAKLDFAGAVLPDFHGLFTQLLGNPEEFMRRSQIFNLFRYDRCFEPSADNYRLTRRWMRYTTVLTKYEAEVCIQSHDFRAYRRLLDIGGNSGEFAFRICRQHPQLEATVFDLPLVCDIGAEHLAAEQEAGRVRFVKGDARYDALPQDSDVVTFKSFLHDWPETLALHFLTKAAQVLPPGGTILIFERGPLRIEQEALPYSMLPNILFLSFFRPPATYSAHLKRIGFESIEIREIKLEMPFHLVTARKGRQN
jgi:SAM-dependent methyltransferase